MNIPKPTAILLRRTLKDNILRLAQRKERIKPAMRDRYSVALDRILADSEAQVKFQRLATVGRQGLLSTSTAAEELTSMRILFTHLTDYLEDKYDDGI